MTYALEELRFFRECPDIIFVLSYIILAKQARAIFRKNSNCFRLSSLHFTSGEVRTALLSITFYAIGPDEMVPVETVSKEDVCT